MKAEGMFSRARWERLADILVVALVVSLPWSTTATGILAALWLIAMLPTLDRMAWNRAIATPAGGLPVLLWVLALLGMAWASGLPFGERMDGFKSFLRLLAIPLLIVQFRRSGRGGAWVAYGFLISCSTLLVLSWINYAKPGFPWLAPNTTGVPVKDYITQSSEFAVCIFLIAPAALAAWRGGQRGRAALLAVWMAVFLVNIVYVSTSRSVLVVFPVLLLLFAFRFFGWKRAVAGLAAAVLLAGFAATAPTVRDNVRQILSEVQNFNPQGDRTRAGERLVFWIKSVEFISAAPVIGHGTGSIKDQFRRSVAGQSGMAALPAENPHNQTFAVAIQLGVAGAAVLFAMWLAHAMLFWQSGLAAWAGLVIVTQNVVGSLFNSLLFDFASGWGYVIGVGVAAGMALKSVEPAAAGPRPEP